MSIIILTPKPPTNTNVAAVAANTSTVADTGESFGARMASDFLHMVGLEGHRFESFEQLRDFAQAQIDAAGVATTIETKVYSDGTQATGVAPLPESSPTEASETGNANELLPPPSAESVS